MSSYNCFADVYDIMMEDTPYDEWTEFIQSIIKNSNIKSDLILELGCGTGNVTNRLAQNGYQMIGLDLSSNMLSIAKEKARVNNLDVLYLCQDMTDFELYGTVGCIISVCDSLNYVTEEEDLLKVFKLVNNYLDPNGLFIFDLNTEYKFKNMLGNQTFAETYETCAYIWNNFYDEKEKLNEYDITFFIEEDGIYKRYEENHLERAYSMEKVSSLLKEAGLMLLDVYDGTSFDSPKETSERLFFVAKEYQKSGGTQ